MTKQLDCDVIIIGAGAAGLAAAATLSRAGKTVRCLEATGRIGGRILTVHDPLAPVAIELGAEFVHGVPTETWEIIRGAALTVYEHTGRGVHLARGRVLKRAPMDELFPKPIKRDESFATYIRRSHLPPSRKDWAARYVEGFNAARKECVSVKSLKQDEEAADKIEGDRSFRIPGGYDLIASALLRSTPGHGGVVHLNSIVERVEWRRGSVEVEYKAALDRQKARLRCRHLIVTVSLGVLQACTIQFTPEPTEALNAARLLKYGHVHRVTFRFARPFWEENESLKCVGFLFSKEKLFPTWWTTHPLISPILTGWMAGSAAEDFSGPDILSAALESLGKILNRQIPQPEATYYHDWKSDPFFRGAYSYVPVDALPAREVLSKPVDDALFFAGEATETQGHGATVHGAIASGFRAASAVLCASRNISD